MTSTDKTPAEKMKLSALEKIVLKRLKQSGKTSWMLVESGLR